ncbi:DUF2490 domain-containing protein [Mucilaginibacter calamicampi]|uniref:DUF2490 domain-containing protein n=1 Tax=Mucilaginibacter calamicampi TaxID=1302352 RepID=A0ABW2YUD8_9SPHI
MFLYKGRYALIFFLTAFSFTARAQNNKTGFLGLMNVLIPGDTTHRWGGYAELQLRTNTFVGQFYYYELHGGISYNTSNKTAFLLGTGRYITDDYRDLSLLPITSEFRMWEQVTINENWQRLNLENRFRVEQRWVNSNYRNRFSYRLSLLFPLTHRQMTANTVYINVNDEISLNNKMPNFERNRFLATLGYQFSTPLRIQAGWSHQYIHTSTNTAAKGSMALAVVYRVIRGTHKPHPHI